MTLSPELQTVIAAAVGAFLMKGIPAVWAKWWTSEAGEKAKLETLLKTEQDKVSRRDEILASKDRYIRRLELYTLALWTSYRTRHPEEADKHRPEMPSSVGEFADAFVKDPELDKELQEFLLKTPKPEAPP